MRGDPLCLAKGITIFPFNPDSAGPENIMVSEAVIMNMAIQN